MLYCALLCCAVLRCAALCCAVLCCTELCCAVLSCAMLCCAVLYCAVLCYAMLSCAMLCCAVLCCAVLCCAASRWHDTTNRQVRVEELRLCCHSPLQVWSSATAVSYFKTYTSLGRPCRQTTQFPGQQAVLNALRAVFNILDLDNNGVLTLAEQEEYFDKIDTNGKSSHEQWEAGERWGGGGGGGRGLWEGWGWGGGLCLSRLQHAKCV